MKAQEQWRYYKPCIFVFLSFIAALLLIGLGTSPWIQGKFIEEAMTPEKLLLGYSRWGWFAICLYLTATILVMAVSIYAMAMVFSSKLASLTLPERVMVRKQTVQIVIVCMWLVLILDCAFIAYEKPFETVKKFEQECEDIQSGKYKTEEVHLHPEDYERASLWKTSKESKCRFTSYYEIGDDNLWDKIYVPDYLDFELDAAHPYNEWRDVEWNKENATRYKITYTPNLRIIVAIETLPPKGIPK